MTLVGDGFGRGGGHAQAPGGRWRDRGRLLGGEQLDERVKRYRLRLDAAGRVVEDFGAMREFAGSGRIGNLVLVNGAAAGEAVRLEARPEVRSGDRKSILSARLVIRRSASTSVQV